MLKDRKILITGGTGSFGKKLVETVLQSNPEISRLVIYSRDELKQYEMEQQFPLSKYKGLRYFIGDVRDGKRLEMACEGIDTIIHAAALKQVPTAEYNPMECIKTNVFGAENVINAAISCRVKNVVALSTDKAAAPINLYGATKLCSDKLFIAANNIKGKSDVKFSVVRYGNVMGSRGSVVPFFVKMKKTKVLPITDPNMTRFNILLEEGVDLVLWTLENQWGGELLVPKIPSFRITDLAKAIGPDCEQKIVGIRPGEKIHEEMITEVDSFTTYDIGKYYAILPQVPVWSLTDYIKHFKAKGVPKKFKFNSETNDRWLNVEQLKKMVSVFEDIR